MSKLNFELVPDGCWYSNLRSELSKSDWAKIKAKARKKANGKCSICGKETTKLETHEVWSYNAKTCVQKLENIIAICSDCHSVVHIGRTQLKGDVVRAEEHYMKVNGCSYTEFRQALGRANELHRELNKVSHWNLDINFLIDFIKEK